MNIGKTINDRVRGRVILSVEKLVTNDIFKIINNSIYNPVRIKVTQRLSPTIRFSEEKKTK